MTQSTAAAYRSHSHDNNNVRSNPRTVNNFNTPTATPTPTPTPSTTPSDAYRTVIDNNKTLRASLANLTPRNRLHLSIGFFLFSLCGVVTTYKLEQMYPPPKPITQAGLKSKIDLMLNEEPELKRMEEEFLETKEQQLSKRTATPPPPPPPPRI